MEATGKKALRRFLTPRWIGVGMVVLAALVAVVLLWFQPQKLFQDTRVDEPPPGTMAKDDDAMAEDDDGMMAGEAMAFAGSFRSIDHTTSGTATVARAGDGHYYVRLEDFSTENGPDLFVYLSAAPATANDREFADEFVNLGSLKGNIGNQNYRVPEGTDLESYESVVIWCRRFTSPFGAAPLDELPT
ncbi:MAG: DM13 domain-containing protein [Actinomycetota bacterium]|nr:DM13 domain-containing protein [Actinomycetota bacterium]